MRASEVQAVVSASTSMQNPENWKPYGGIEGNSGPFEIQQNEPIPALIEKITNAIDAALIKACLLNDVDPESEDAPRTMAEAVERFYGIKNGEIGELRADPNRSA